MVISRATPRPQQKYCEAYESTASLAVTSSILGTEAFPRLDEESASPLGSSGGGGAIGAK